MVLLESYSSPQIKLIHEFDRGFLEKDVKIIGKPLHKDFRHIVYPRSLGVPAETKEEWLKKMEGIFNSPAKFNEVSYTKLPLDPG